MAGKNDTQDYTVGAILLMIGLLVAWYFILVGIIAWMLKHPDDDIQLLGWILVGIMGIVFLIYVVKKSLMGA